MSECPETLEEARLIIDELARQIEKANEQLRKKKTESIRVEKETAQDWSRL